MPPKLVQEPDVASYVEPLGQITQLALPARELDPVKQAVQLVAPCEE